MGFVCLPLMPTNLQAGSDKKPDLIPVDARLCGVELQLVRHKSDDVLPKSGSLRRAESAKAIANHLRLNRTVNSTVVTSLLWVKACAHASVVAPRSNLRWRSNRPAAINQRHRSTKSFGQTRLGVDLGRCFPMFRESRQAVGKASLPSHRSAVS